MIALRYTETTAWILVCSSFRIDHNDKNVKVETQTVVLERIAVYIRPTKSSLILHNFYHHITSPTSTQDSAVTGLGSK